MGPGRSKVGRIPILLCRLDIRCVQDVFASISHTNHLLRWLVFVGRCFRHRSENEPRYMPIDLSYGVFVAEGHPISLIHLLYVVFNTWGLNGQIRYRYRNWLRQELE